jgi:serine/threonine protein kinase
MMGEFFPHSSLRVPKGGSIESQINHMESETEQAQRAKGDILLQVNDYHVRGILGRGSFGVVYLVDKEVKIDDPNHPNVKVSFTQHYAMKELSSEDRTQSKLLDRIRNATLNNDSDKSILKEIAIMKSLRHPNLVLLKEIIREVAPPHTMFIIMEYAKFGNCMRTSSAVNDGIGNSCPIFICPMTNGPMGEALAARVFRELSSAVKYLHSNRIAHRDLKIENILFDERGTVRVADFGVSHVFKADDSLGHVSDTAGTWAYWAPEMCDENNEEPYSAYKADVWAAGVCLYIFIYGRMPFWGDQLGALFNEIKEANPGRPHRVSDELDAALCKLLDPNPLTRPSFRDVFHLEWVVQHDEAGAGSPMSPRPGDLKVKRDTSGEIDLENVITGGYVHINKLYAANLKSWVNRAKVTVGRRNTDLIAATAEVERKSMLKMEAKLSMHDDSFRTLDNGMSMRSIDLDPDSSPRTAAKVNAEMPTPVCNCSIM